MIHNTRLAASFTSFDPTDTAGLAANRAGEVTPEQKRALRGRLMTRFIGLLLAVLIFAPMFVCFGVGVFSTLQDDEPGISVILGVFLLLFLVIGLWSAIQAIRPALGLIDLMGNRVEAAEGRLAWRRNEYRGQVEGRTLIFLPGTEIMPGGYRFYFLPRSGYIVSLERSFLGSAGADPLTEVRRALQDVFGFVDDDLPDNQAGRLSQRQVTAHLWSNFRSALIMGPFLLLALAFMIGFPAAFVGVPLLQGEPVGEGWIPALFGLLLGGLFVAFLGWAILSPFWDVLRGEVASIEGEVEERAITTGSGKNRRTNYYYIVNGQRFDVGMRGHAALVQGGRYRLYYFPRSKGVVAVEPLG
ncbi:MAG: hypothetical protein ACT4QE_16825 [Anaerolineales bacterium]